ncbi:MAG TPA: hypothetical protein VG935_04640 [Patescibacteria group bacterium]|nr:hypothetical protein [Patescibacteria group bacterium]
MAQTTTTDIITTMEGWFKKAPDLPLNIKQVLVNITPWIALIFGVLGIVAGLGEIGVSPLALFGGIHNSVLVLIAGVLAVIASVFLLLAYPKTKALKAAGWRYLFWSAAISVLATLITGSIIGAIIGGLIKFYLLFQIKSYYK